MTRSILSFVLVAAFGWPTFAQEASPAPLKVLTYNIRYASSGDGEDIWKNRRERVNEVIQQSDIVGLQEVTAGQFEDVRKGTPDFSWYGPARNDGKQDGEACPVGYRTDRFKSLGKGTFWLSESPDVVGSKGWDAALPRIASWVRLQASNSDKTFLVVCTHFDHRGPTARHRSGELIRGKLPELAGPNDRIIVMGDLNARPDSDALKALLAPPSATEEGRTNLSDSRSLSKSTPSGPSGTFNGFRKIVPDVQIDYILLAGDWTVLTHQTLDPKTSTGRFASDHQPIMVELR
ncbi:Endonuclease/Exonuclease/phosphatase family protein [Roseimaritima multifibrata]|uniref:Endonuclease/Exonuclease/phosphatase family protein n=1 Tax=Roseimaritima multifibrata TaxID=1930274 RepID=A0A517MP39_9BACT|nr:endonuclease/exonuclease/phosphatase family protein [Roseimaritima multifibrata]QDS96642.1 Endonuclease/Exonuclease/phosphatase family protein [Roseimaritima multifibrata]